MSERPIDTQKFDLNDPLAGLAQEYFSGLSPEIVAKAQTACLDVCQNFKGNVDLSKAILLWSQESLYHEIEQTRLAAFYAAALSQKIDWMGAKSLERLLMGCFFKDFGMMKLPAVIRGKAPAKMNPEEAALYQKHPEEGVNFLCQLSSVEEAVRHVVYQHHECVDGSGFPNHLSNIKLYPLAKVVALADFFATSIIEDKILPLEALKRFMSNRAALAKYDPDIIRSLVKVFIKNGESKKNEGARK
ncbi:MAG: hypothetical protein HYV97_08335 [Bdellovibrio sp.]|nr:hypothetical protein [Bdellovibrio sp.]